MKKCELCKSLARIYCDSDQASLCFDCDAKVHAANFLVAKHTRTLLCNICQSLTPWTASGPKLTPTASVCNNCIADSNCREEIRNENRRNSDEDDDDDRNHRGEDISDDGDSGGGGGGGDDDDDDDDDEENQVVPWSSTAPPPASSSSNSDRESYNVRWNSNSDESSSFQSISVSFRSSSSVFQNHTPGSDHAMWRNLRGDIAKYSALAKESEKGNAEEMSKS